MTKKTKINDDDLELFRQAMRDVAPLKQKDKVDLKTKEKKPSYKPKLDEPKNTFYFPVDKLEPKTVSSEDKLSYQQASISSQIIKKMKKGSYSVEAILDLHGATLNEASVELASFLEDCLDSNAKLALIIHGKGYHSNKATLKNAVSQWLKLHPKVLAYTSATQKHGGNGALYVLLARK